MRGQVARVFPTEFVLHVTEPPPQEALLQGMAYGNIVLLSEQTPARVEAPSVSRSGDCGFGTGQTCRETEEFCVSDGRCYERELECRVSMCELLEANGDPGVVDAYVVVDDSGSTETVKGEFVVGKRPDVDENASVFSSERYTRAECGAGVCLNSTIYCTFEDECYSALYRCLDQGADLQHSSFGKQLSCEVREEQGDRSILAGTQTAPTASNYSVLYLTEEGLALMGDLLDGVKLGYNLFEALAPDTQQLIQRGRCMQNAVELAMFEFSRLHNTSQHLGSGNLTPAETDELAELERRYLQRCDNLWEAKLVRNPAETSLRIKLGTPPNLP